MLRKVLLLRPKPSFANIKKSITKSFVLIFVCALLLVAGIYLALTQGGYDVNIINLAGKQRMLSEKIIKGIYSAQITDAHLNELRKDTEEWHKMHIALQNGNSFLNTPVLSNKLNKILKEITPYHLELLNIAKRTDIEKLSSQELQHVVHLGRKYLVGMDTIVTKLEKELTLELYDFKNMIILLSLVFILLIWALYQLYVKSIIDSVRLLAREKEIQYDHLQAIMESTKNQIWTLDRNYHLIFHNSSFVDYWAKFYGIVPKIGDNILNFPYNRKNPHHIQAHYDRALSGKYFSIESKMELNNENFHYELTFIPIRDNNNMVNGCSIYQRDITHRVNTLSKLKDSESSLLEAQKMANIGSWEWDVSNNKIKWSKQLYTILGKDKKDYKPSYKELVSQIHSEDRRDFKKNILDSLDAEGSFNISNRMLLDDGSIRYMRHMGKVYSDENNEMIRVAGTTQDLTLLEKSKQQIIRQYRELQNFVYIVSHNVRGPITTILGLLQLYDESSNSKKEEIVEMVGLTVDKLDGTIKDLNHSLSLKNFSQSELERVQLKQIVEDVLILISSEIEKTNAKVNINFNSSTHVFGLKSYFSNIFYNLIINALKYKSRDRALIIDICASPNSIGGIEITISDNGIGMELNDDRRKKIFDMYGRLSGTASGKGLGLYLVKVQVEAMNGSIEVESDLDQGTSFTLNLPSYS